MKHWLCNSRWRLLPGLLAAGLTLTTARLGIFQPLEHRIYHSLFQLRGEQPWDDRVAVIEIDEPSLAALGDFPWPRHYYAELLDQLAPEDSSVIAFDILFAKSTEEDADLARAMARHGNVVLATAWDEQRGVIGPNASVVEGAIATGHIHHQADADGITRNYHPQINGTPALSIAAVQQYEQNQPSTIATVRNSHQNLWLNWRGAAHSTPRYSFVDVLTGQVPTGTFNNKIVFIGFTGEGLDAMTTPYNQNPPVTGVYQHIVAANNLLAQNHLKPIVWPVRITFMAIGLVLGYQLFYRRNRAHLLANLTVIVFWGGAVMVAFHHNYWLPTVVPLGTITATSVGVKLSERLQNQLKRLQLEHTVRVTEMTAVYEASVNNQAGPKVLSMHGPQV